MTPAVDTSVRKTITVKASAERAFRVFTEGIDTWWPKTHHIGSSPMTKAVLEGRSGGRCYSEQRGWDGVRLGKRARMGSAAALRDGLDDYAARGNMSRTLPNRAKWR